MYYMYFTCTLRGLGGLAGGAKPDHSCSWGSLYFGGFVVCCVMRGVLFLFGGFSVLLLLLGGHARLCFCKAARAICVLQIARTRA